MPHTHTHRMAQHTHRMAHREREWNHTHREWHSVHTYTHRERVPHTHTHTQNSTHTHIHTHTHTHPTHTRWHPRSHRCSEDLVDFGLENIQKLSNNQSRASVKTPQNDSTANQITAFSTQQPIRSQLPPQTTQQPIRSQISTLNSQSDHRFLLETIQHPITASSSSMSVGLRQFCLTRISS